MLDKIGKCKVAENHKGSWECNNPIEDKMRKRQSLIMKRIKF
jgi:hypothetical protein